jgi:magnesium transporter
LSNHAIANLITTQVPVIYKETTIAEVEKLLVKKTKMYETINYIYVVDNLKKLKGVISLKEIFRLPKNQLISKIIKTDLIKAHIHSSQEHVALLALKHNLKAIPIISKSHKFLGVIPFDAILKILDSESVENLLRFGGVFHHGTYDNVLNISIWESLKHRLPWLVLGVIGGMLAAIIVHSFEETISQNIILAAFIPLIIYMSDAVGTQMEAFIIRDLAVDPDLNFLKYFFRQLLIILIIASIISSGVIIFSLLVYHNTNISIVLFIALFIAIISSVLTGLIIPYVFSKFHFDPANASGPVATIIQDILSILIYFSIATLFI